jgi:hypothetical protein
MLKLCPSPISGGHDTSIRQIDRHEEDIPMHSGNDTLTQLRDLLEKSQASLTLCESAYQGFLSFGDNAGGIVCCTMQLQQAARALREYAGAVLAIAGDIHTTSRDSAAQLELLVEGITGRP